MIAGVRGGWSPKVLLFFAKQPNKAQGFIVLMAWVNSLFRLS